MTFQTPDTVIYKRKKYLLAAANGSGLFDPADYGIKAKMLSTACWRGYQCTYTIRKSLLHLATATIGIDNEGITGELCMADMHDSIKFTGGMLLANDFISGYPRMMSAAIYGYTTVHELLFENGRVTACIDHSMAMEEFRRWIVQQHADEPWQITRTDVQEWMEQVFSRKYS